MKEQGLREISRRKLLRQGLTLVSGALIFENIGCASSPSKEDLLIGDKLRSAGANFTNSDVANNAVKTIPGIKFPPSELNDALRNGINGFEGRQEIPRGTRLDDDFYHSTEGGGIGFFPGRPPLFYPKRSYTEETPPQRSFLLTRAYDSATPITVSTALNKDVSGATVWLTTLPPEEDKWNVEGRQSLWLVIEIETPHTGVDMIVSYKELPKKESK